jgi:hypothetical protein
MMSQARAPIKNHADLIKFPSIDAKIARSPRLIFPQVNNEGII